MLKLFSLSAAIGAALGLSLAPATDLASRAAYAILPPCPAEDSPGPCTWDASRQGNGRGQSFFAIGGQAFFFNTEEGAGQ